MSKKDYNKAEVKPQVVEKATEEVMPAERQKAEQIVSVKERKKGIFERLVVGIVGPDGLVGIGKYLSNEIIIPAVKDIVVNSLTSGINMAVYGDDRPRGGRAYNRNGSRVNYTSYSSSPERNRTAPSRDTNRRNDVGYYELEDRDSARKVLEGLLDLARQYQYATVADYYDMIGVETEFTHANFGWSYDTLVTTPIMSAGRNGYIIDLPRPVELKG